MVDLWSDAPSIPPGYFVKLLFRIAAVLAVAVWVLAVWSNGWKLTGSFQSCPSTSHEGCWYDTYEAPCSADNPLCTPATHTYIAPGATLGERPSWLASNASMVLLGILLLAFGLNHALWLRRKQ